MKNKSRKEQGGTAAKGESVDAMWRCVALEDERIGKRKRHKELPPIPSSKACTCEKCA